MLAPAIPAMKKTIRETIETDANLEFRITDPLEVI
jgi:hypothetical protein